MNMNDNLTCKCLRTFTHNPIRDCYTHAVVSAGVVEARKADITHGSRVSRRTRTPEGSTLRNTRGAVTTRIGQTRVDDLTHVSCRMKVYCKEKYNQESDILTTKIFPLAPSILKFVIELIHIKCVINTQYCKKRAGSVSKNLKNAKIGFSRIYLLHETKKTSLD